MKKYFILLVVFIGLIFSGCENYLDKSPDLGLDTDKVYSDYYDYRSLVDNAHYHVVNQLRFREQGTNHMIGSISDEAQYRYGSGQRMFNSGDWLNQTGNYELGFNFNANSTTYYGSVMGGAFIGLRIANLAIANIDKLKTFPAETGYTPAELRGHLLGQAYFLRSHFYFQIIQRMGGMPLFDRAYGSDEDLDLERLSYRESTTWLVAGLDSAAKYLPAVWETKDQPRPTKSSALALKAMALLYDASPLMNPDKGYTYDIERCKDAARASVDALNAAANSGFHIMYPWNQWFDNFYSQNTYVSREAIYLPPMGGRPNWTTYNRNGLGWMMAPWDGGWTAWSFPTQNAVDWFETADGYAIEDAPPASYDPQNPHVNRDPRLKATIWVEGDNMYVGAVPSPIPAVLETWPGGYHWNNAQTTTPQWTGYVFKKWMPAGHNKYDKAPGWWYKMMPYMRYAQLYLDFAEAANERHTVRMVLFPVPV